MIQQHYPELKRSFQFFKDMNAFVRHFYKHICDRGIEGQRWARVLPLTDEPWRTAMRSRHQRRSGRALLESDAGAGALLQALYAAFSGVAGTGIAYSASRPVYARIEEVFTRTFSGRSGKANSTYYFLSQDGFVVLARSGIVRTVFFPISLEDGSIPGAGDFQRQREAPGTHGLKTMTRRRYFADGMHFLIVKCLSAEAVNRRRYDGHSASYTTATRVERIVPENFTNAINPWDRPPRDRHARLTREEQDFFDRFDAKYLTYR